MTTDGADPPGLPEPPPTRRRRWMVVVAAIAGVLVVIGAIAFATRSRTICDEDKRNALLSIATFDDVEASVADLPIPEGATSPGGCSMSYVTAGDADEIARYYADTLRRAGWYKGLAEAGMVDYVEQIHENPYTLWVDVSGAALEDAGWDDLRYEVIVTEIGPGRARVDAAVIRDNGSVY